jgi:hypothetical protein
VNHDEVNATANQPFVIFKSSNCCYSLPVPELLINTVYNWILAPMRRPTAQSLDKGSSSTTQLAFRLVNHTAGQLAGYEPCTDHQSIA